MLYVYAFAQAPASVPSVSGIDSAAVEIQSAAPLDVVVSRHEAAVEANEATIVAHARVVEAVAAANDAVLPARFGSMHADEQALRAAVAERASELAAALTHVDGCVELGVRAVAATAEPVAAPSSGSDYMRTRLEQRRETARLADELHAPLADLARATTKTVGATERLLLSAAYLVPDASVATFRDRVASLVEDHPDLGIVCTGPWPPYSFATVEAGSS